MSRNSFRRLISLSFATCIGLGIMTFTVMGCGGNQAATPAETKSAELESARAALQEKSKNKNVSAVQNLGVRERRALKSAGEIGK